jgi:hypothetical protein
MACGEAGAFWLSPDGSCTPNPLILGTVDTLAAQRLGSNELLVIDLRRDFLMSAKSPSWRVPVLGHVVDEGAAATSSDATKRTTDQGHSEQ